MLNPVFSAMLGSGVLPSVLREVVCDHVRWTSFLEYLSCPRSFYHATRLYGDGGPAVIYALSKHFGVMLLALVSQQRAIVLDAFVVY
jgi:hypothetical protein